MKSKIRRMFPGGNTSEGFYSYFDNILGRDAKRLYILKGGPGTGKSTIMRKFADKALELNLDLEYHHCASDPSSVDVVVVPELKVAILDGTAPHTIDPKVPGAIGEIINLGQFWDEEKIVKNREEIRDLLETNSKYYVRTYKYLKAARSIYEDIVWKNKQSLDLGKKNIEEDRFVKEIFKDIEYSKNLGYKRHLFGSMYTPDGWVEYTHTLLEGLERVYSLKGDIGTGKSDLLERITEEGIKSGYDVEVFHSPLIPSKLETVIIKDLSLAVTISERGYDAAVKTLNLNEFINLDKVKPHKQDIHEDKLVIENLIYIAIKNLSKTKENHDQLESFYSPNMDFSKLEEVSNDIIKKTFI